MHDEAINYLKFVHGLEIAAGMNFNAAIVDLGARNRLKLPMLADLTRAQHQEMHHASMIREMLQVLGYSDMPELMAIPRRIVAGLGAGLPEPWPEGMDAYAAICFNHELETKFAGGGVQAFAQLLERHAKRLPAVPQGLMAFQIRHFLLTVEADERWHVELDARVMDLYQQIHGSFDMPGLLARTQVTRSPFIHIIKAKRAFIRSLP